MTNGSTDGGPAGRIGGWLPLFLLATMARAVIGLAQPGTAALRLSPLGAAFLALDVVGIALVLRRDARAPTFWQLYLAASLLLTGASLLAQRAMVARISPGNAFEIVATEGLLVAVWLPLWIGSERVAATFGRAGVLGRAPAGRAPAGARRPAAPIPAGVARGATVLAVLWTALVLVPRASIEDTGVPDWGARVWWYSGFALGAAALWIVTAAWARATAARAIPRPWPWLAPLLLAGSAAATLFWMLRDFSLTSGGFGSSASHALIGALAPLELGIWALALWTVGRSARLVG